MRYVITRGESQRINILKVWLSVMVVFIHSYSVTSGESIVEVPAWLQSFKYLISQAISGCAVPAFFLISSILLFKNDNLDWKANIKKKTKTLLVPYVLINTFWILFYCVVQSIPFLKGYFSSPGNTVANWGALEFVDKYVGFTGYPVCYPLWFLRNLFVLNVLAVVIKKAVDLFPKLVFAVLLFAWFFILPQSALAELALQSLFFFALGYYIVKFNMRLSCVDKVRGLYIFAFYACTLLLELCLMCLFRGSLVQSYVHKINMLVGIVFWFRCVTLFRKGSVKNVVLLISKYSFCIYLFHELNLTILKKLCYKLLPQYQVIQLLEYIALPIFIIVCCILFSILLERCAPRLYGVLTGGRVR